MLQQPVTRGRPLGITIISIIAAIHGVLTIIGGILSLHGATFTPAVIAIILGILTLILAWGLWTLQRWAFWGLVIVEVLQLLDGIYAWVTHTPGPGIVTIIIALIVLIYLFADRNVRAAFGTSL
jgi:uncharacterized membrane protein (DUF2068 family)